jgi:riboflavin synthase
MVNGVCLTVAMVEGDEMHADIGPETARVTTLGALRPGQPVNLERAMRADARFGGHIVQGHVDGTGTIDQLREDGEAHWLTIRFPPALAPLLIRKGSIAVDGISLTVASLDDRNFDVMIIPFTWTHTNVWSLQTGDHVNLECDVVGKYIARLAEVFARQS